ncbi:LytR family transcriptional regulator [Pontibacillus halophilus JSM 076056 = DSM 19796]|uniref:Regulatory protein MsrR n=1 Tax=Pontibacillus halophilus JSM 076056 = DSM 19796 TaxID=1385510 RepID=A0A0A5GL19_9BACI|nr:LCP family protein [Pontibacillus halophilus]KGX92684.1 LytR family transcriptional regulator [Pontibacillus halophilus JSM 076056 = DSM 19796]
MGDSRILVRRKKRKRKRKLLISIIALLIVGIISYSGYEYTAGLLAAQEEAGEQTSTSQEDTNYAEDFQGAKTPEGKTNVLLLGVDQRGEEVTRSDTIMIGQYDADTDSTKLVSIMRDTYVKIPGYGYNKINSAFAYGGPELMRQTIKENFGIDIEYYAIVDFNGFTQIVDTIAPKGIKIDVEKDMYYKDGAGTINLKEGTQLLNGEELLGYARFRKDAESDFGRVRRQQQVIGAMKDKFISVTGITKLPRVMGTVQPYVETNMGMTSLLGYGKEFILNTPSEIETLRIPEDSNVWNDRVSGVGAVLRHDEATTEQAIQDFLK